MMDRIKETDIASRIISWMQEQNWDIYQEVQFNTRNQVADIVAVRKGIMWIIETKAHYGLDVLSQAAAWPVHYRSIGIPRSKHRGDFRVAKDYYRVGIIEVSLYDVTELSRPPIFVKNHSVVKKYLAQLTELHKTFSQAGSQSGHHLTPYRQTMLDVRSFIEKSPGCTIRDIYNQLGVKHYSSARSFMGSLLQSLESFEPWCCVNRDSKPARLFVKTP